MKPQVAHGPAYRILIVDDNQAIHDDLRKILDGDSPRESGLLEDEELLFDAKPVQSARFSIDSAYQGQQGLVMLEQAVAEHRPYTLAFVDVRMPPGWDGIETVSRLWKVSPDLQVVICTAYSDYSWNDMVRKLGQSDSMVILKKPFDNIEVIQLTHALSKKWTVSQEARAKREDLERMVEQATTELTYHANYDTLTSLPNRRLFTDRLQQAILMARRQGEQLALMYIDLDGFKIVNDTLGHAAGDLLLLEAVKRMREGVRQCDTLARMGGDEFTLIATGTKGQDAAAVLADRLREVLHAAFRIDGNDLFVTACVGIAMYPEDGRDVTALLRHSDVAMYEAKRRGKNRTVFYTPEIGRAVSDRMEIETSLRAALAGRQFSLHYQPEFELGTQRLVRFEALLRWNHPLFGLIPPGRFIPIAEECGFIVPIGNWVLEQACRTAKRLSEAGCHGVPVAVNVSAQQFSRPDFVETVMGTVRQAGIDPKLLELELTESVIVRDLNDITPKIEQLRELGIAVAIDDFGSGYSSFSYLEKLPVAAIKVDRCFVESIDTVPKARAVVNGMVALAHSLGLRVVVEGVETAAQLRALVDCSADEVQGFLLGRPAPVEQYLSLLSAGTEPETAMEAEAGLAVA